MSERGEIRLSLKNKRSKSPQPGRKIKKFEDKIEVRQVCAECSQRLAPSETSVQIILSQRDFDRCLMIQGLPVYESKSSEEPEEECKVIELNQLLGSPSTSQVKIVSRNNSPVRMVAPAISRAESERKATQKLDEGSPFSVASTQDATPSRLVRTDTDLTLLLDDMMAQSPNRVRKVEIR